MLQAFILCFNFLTTPDICGVIKQVTNNKPDINITYAKELGENIVAASNKHNLDPYVYAAILMQESGYTLNTVNSHSKDFGMSQINIRTIKAFGFDKKLLTTNLKYSIDAGAIVLADFKKRYFKREGHDYWSRYNTSKPHLRAVYKRKVIRHFPQKGRMYVEIRNQ